MSAAASHDGVQTDVVIVTADTRELTLGCLAALADEPEIARTIVVDNASRDGTCVAIAERFGAVTVARLDEPAGFARACNVGARRGGAPYVLFLNSDIVVEPGAIGRLLAELVARPSAVAAGGRLVDPGTGATQAAYRPRTFPSFATLAVQLLGIEERWPANPVTRRHFGAGLGDEHTLTVEQPAAAALLVRRETLDTISGFDERFWFWFEDSDLLRRLHARGDVLYVPSAPFRHLGGGTFARWTKVERIRSLHHGMLHYADAQLPRPQRALLGTLVLAISAPRIVLFARSRADEAAAWRAVAGAGAALVRGRRVPPLAGPES